MIILADLIMLTKVYERSSIAIARNYFVYAALQSREREKLYW